MPAKGNHPAGRFDWAAIGHGPGSAGRERGTGTGPGRLPYRDRLRAAVMERVWRNDSRNGPPVVPRPGAVHAGGLGDLGHAVLPLAVQAALQPGTPFRPPRRRPRVPPPAAIRCSDRHRHPGVVENLAGVRSGQNSYWTAARWAAIGWRSFPMICRCSGLSRQTRYPSRSSKSATTANSKFPGQAEVGPDVVGARYRQQRMSHAATCSNIFRALCHNSSG